MTVKIVFRGLLVFNQMNGAMQIGALWHPHAASVLQAQPHHMAHVPRIITTRNGVISSVFDLRTRPELNPPNRPGHVRNWEIYVSHPVHPTARTDEQGTWDRKNHTYARDFRWLSHLEGTDLHGPINDNDLLTDTLTMVLKVQNGHFYTDQLSRSLLRKTVTNGVNGPEVSYGQAAEVTGCDIPTNGGDVQLRVNGNVVFKFKGSLEDGVVYEFNNGPPDVLPDRVYSPQEWGHFRQFYQLFGAGAPADRYDLIPEVDTAPAPDPALCGAARVTPRPDGF